MAILADTPFAIKGKFYERLNNEIVKIATTREVILLGDLNGRMGRKTKKKRLQDSTERILQKIMATGS